MTDVKSNMMGPQAMTVCFSISNSLWFFLQKFTINIIFMFTTNHNDLQSVLFGVTWPSFCLIGFIVSYTFRKIFSVYILKKMNWYNKVQLPSSGAIE